MAKLRPRRSDEEKLADIINDAGGKIVGRTRLHKFVCLLELTGLGEGFEFEYHHYGPYSEALASATQRASLFQLVEEKEIATAWGGSYSVYRLINGQRATINTLRAALAKLVINADPVELELAATAAFLAKHGISNAWDETQKRKPTKSADGRLNKAKSLYASLSNLSVPQPLPQIRA